MDLKFAHYRNRFCMFRTYYALANGLVKPDGFTLSVTELPDPPSHELEEALIQGDIDVANLYLPNFLNRMIDGAWWESPRSGNPLPKETVCLSWPMALSEQPKTLPGDSLLPITRLLM